MLHIRSFTFNPFQENTYLVYLDSGACMIVDPGCSNEKEEALLTKFIETNKLKPMLLANTHAHIDHVLGNRFVEKTYGLSPIIHRLEQPVMDAVERVAEMYGVPYTAALKYTFYEESEIELEGEKFDIFFVPGHAPGHIALYHKSSGSLFSGDVLFRESIGRTDLPGGNTDQLLDSIRNILFELPDETRVFAGHMGPTTIGHEKKHNPFLK